LSSSLETESLTHPYWLPGEEVRPQFINWHMRVQTGRVELGSLETTAQHKQMYRLGDLMENVCGNEVCVKCPLNTEENAREECKTAYNNRLFSVYLPKIYLQRCPLYRFCFHDFC